VHRSAASAIIGLEALRANPLRTALSTLGVVIGVASLVAILALGDGLERFTRQQVENTTDLQVITVQPLMVERTADGVFVRRTDVPILGAAEADSLSAATGGRADVTLALTGSSYVAIPGDTARRAALVTGTLPGAEKILPLALAHGRLFTVADLAAGGVAIISPSLAKLLAPSAEASAMVGRAITVDGARYTVVGVLAGAAAGAGRVYVPLDPAALARLGENGREAPTAMLKARRVEDVERVRADAERWLTRRYGPAGGRFTVGSSQRRVAQAKQGILVFKLIMGSITGIAILVGGIGIMNVLLASVAERTREIGIRKAVGARRADIRVQFLAESVAIAGVGSCVGVLLGLSGAFGITAAVRALAKAPIWAAFTWSTPVVAVVAALAVGITFGTYPASRAAGLSPIEAIRHE
jgi:putative ABC transport system permease protein